MKDINTYLVNLAKELDFPASERERIDNSFKHLKEKIWGVFQNQLRDVLLFGSYQRGTILPDTADKNADVDVMIIFKGNEFQPKTYLNQLKNFGEKTYPRSDVFPDYPSVVVELEHVKFELVPACIEKDFWGNETLYIPGQPSKEIKWIETSPFDFKEKLIDKDKEKGNQTIPIIKIFKYWNALNNYPFSSYTLEKVAVNENVSGRNLKECFYDFVNEFEDYHMTAAAQNTFAALKERVRKLKVFEEERISDYVVHELSAFIPLPNQLTK